LLASELVLDALVSELVFEALVLGLAAAAPMPEFELVLLVQLSETMFTLSTLMELLAVSCAPLTWMVCPTCAFRSSVLPDKVQLLPDWSASE